MIATHAWCQVWAGTGVGWVDVDPTHGYFPEDDHVVTAVGRDYSDVPPNRGLWKGDATETMSVIVKHRTDLDLVMERVGVKLGQPDAAPAS